jgi:gas vesicle protein
MKADQNQGGTSMYEYDKSTEASTSVFAFLAGALIGAGVAMLLAPRSGAETRQWLSDYAEKAKDQMGTAIESGKEYLQAGVDRGKEYLETAQGKAREAGEQLGRQAERTFNRGPQKG